VAVVVFRRGMLPSPPQHVFFQIIAMWSLFVQEEGTTCHIMRSTRDMILHHDLFKSSDASPGLDTAVVVDIVVVVVVGIVVVVDIVVVGDVVGCVVYMLVQTVKSQLYQGMKWNL